MKKLLAFGGCMLFSLLVFSQNDLPDLMEFNLERNSLNRQGMTILASWSIASIALSSTQLRSQNSISQAYHQMNLGWNLVNLSIAGFALYQSYHFNADLGLWESLQEQASIKRILAVNAALDVAYIAGGFYLREYARRADNYDRFEGFGRAVIVNGAFLFSFDLLMYWAHHNHELRELAPLLNKLHISPQGLGFKFSF